MSCFAQKNCPQNYSNKSFVDNKAQFSVWSTALFSLCLFWGPALFPNYLLAFLLSASIFRLRNFYCKLEWFFDWSSEYWISCYTWAGLSQYLLGRSVCGFMGPPLLFFYSSLDYWSPSLGFFWTIYLPQFELSIQPNS